MAWVWGGAKYLLSGATNKYGRIGFEIAETAKMTSSLSLEKNANAKGI